MKFSEELWQSIETVYQKILALPFNVELMKGTLQEEKFKFYIQQDSLYLVDYGKALAIMGSKAYHAEDTLQFLKFAQDAFLVERALHEAYFKDYNIQPAEEKSPACFLYTNFLLAEASLKNHEVGVAALLPCFWIYWKVGLHIYENAAQNNPYQNWIETYAGEDFTEATRKAIAMTDDLADKAGEKVRQQMKESFIWSSKLEYMFWESAYRLENWMI